jgi:hypothetical protein
LKFHAQQGLGKTHATVIEAVLRMGEAMERSARYEKVVPLYKTMLEELRIDIHERSPILDRYIIFSAFQSIYIYIYIYIYT